MSRTATAPEPVIAPVADGRLYTHPLLLMLLLTYACNFMDRTVIGTLAQAIKVDLKVTDAQLGLLQGLAFVVLYSVMGLPIARLAERRNRVTIISVCVAAWSVMTMLCGLAQGFGQLLLFRIGVGVGEAGCNAPSHSMIADAFAPERRSRAISLYNLGATIGTMVGAMSSGIIAQHFGWRAAFIIVGAPGLLLAVALKTSTKEPARTRLVADEAAPPPDVGAVAVAAAVIRSPALRHMVMGFTLTSFTLGGLGGFNQPYYIRNFDLTYSQIGLIFGFTGGLAAAASLLSSGRLADATTRGDPRWHAWIPAIGLTIAAPFATMAYLAPTWPIALSFGVVASLFASWFIAPTLSAIHKIVGPRRVAMAMALILMFQNLLGLGLGPYFTGAAIDLAGQHFFALHGLGDFAVMCPGGAAAAGSDPALTQACHSSLVHATRLGLLLTILAEPWAFVHFLLAARHLRRELPGASATVPIRR